LPSWLRRTSLRAFVHGVRLRDPRGLPSVLSVGDTTAKYAKSLQPAVHVSAARQRFPGACAVSWAVDLRERQGYSRAKS